MMINAMLSIISSLAQRLNEAFLILQSHLNNSNGKRS